jgi:hypothetical protein
VPADFALDDEETEYARLHGLDRAQMAWRRAKIAELKDPLLFRQENPATAQEAFQLTGHDSFIPPGLVLKARKFACEGLGPLIVGADPARFGNDRFSLAWRRGRKVEKVESRVKLDNVEGANWIRAVIERDKPARVFIDVGGMPGVYDLLKAWGYCAPGNDIVRPVDFGAPPFREARYGADGKPLPGPKNRRAEMWAESKEWLQDLAGVDIPDSDALQADACAVGYSYSANSELVLWSKETMRAKGIRSPDEWDAVALTFAEPVAAPRPKPQLVRGPRGPAGWLGA